MLAFTITAVVFYAYMLRTQIVRLIDGKETPKLQKLQNESCDQR